MTMSNWNYNLCLDFEAHSFCTPESPSLKWKMGKIVHKQKLIDRLIMCFDWLLIMWFVDSENIFTSSLFLTIEMAFYIEAHAFNVITFFFFVCVCVGNTIVFCQRIAISFTSIEEMLRDDSKLIPLLCIIVLLCQVIESFITHKLDELQHSIIEKIY